MAPPERTVHIGFDVGTQGTKAVAIDVREARIIGRASAAYGLIPGLPEGAAEQHPQTWIDAVRQVAAALSQDVHPGRVAGVGVSGQQHGLVVLDQDDRVVRPAKLWCDTTTAEQARVLSGELGRAIPAGFTAPKVRFVQEREPDAWRRVRRVMLPHDYVNHRLTGEHRTEAGDASGTGWLDPETRQYDPRALSALAVADLVPELVEPGEVLGTLSGDGARLLGLSPGIPVACGGGDNMMSAIGSGATRPGVVVASLGTSGTVFAYAERPVVDPDGAIAAFCDSTGGWLPLLCVMNMTGVAEEVCAAFPGQDHESLTRAAAEVPAGAHGLLWLPYLAGERVPDLPGAHGVLTGIRPGTLRPAALYRAAIEGTTLSLALGVERMKALGIEPSTVRAVGGGARNPLWRQVLADALAVPVARLAEPESAALGAALQSAWTAARARGDTTSITELAEPFVLTAGPEATPRPEAVEVYAQARAELARMTERIFGQGL